MYEDPPCESDLVDHLQLIKEAAQRDRDIAKAKVCVLSIHFCWLHWLSWLVCFYDIS